MEKDNPILSIIVFLFVCILIPILDSPRIIAWGDAIKSSSFFHALVLNTASAGIHFRESDTVLGNLLKDGEYSWQIMRKSPMVKSLTLIEFPDTYDNLVVLPISKDEEVYNEVIAMEEEDYQEDIIKIDEMVKVIEEEVIIEEDTARLEGPFRILIVGDSLIAVGGGLGDPLERILLAYDDVSVKRQGIASTGLFNVKYFDWKTRIKELIYDYDPNIVIVFFGTNDSQGYINEQWNRDYSAKVNGFMSILKSEEIMTFWIGMPIMKKESFSRAMQNINRLQAEEAEKFDNIHYIATWGMLADNNGQYLSVMKDEKGVSRLLRLKDGIHLQYFAGEIVSRNIIGKMEEYIVLNSK